MKQNLVYYFIGLVALVLYIWFMFTIANSGPKFKCIDGFMYQNYMTDDVYTKTDKQCVEIK